MWIDSNKRNAAMPLTVIKKGAENQQKIMGKRTLNFESIFSETEAHLKKRWWKLCQS